MLNDFGVVSTCKNRTLGRRSAPESVIQRLEFNRHRIDLQNIGEIYPVEERVSPRGSVFLSPWGCACNKVHALASDIIVSRRDQSSFSLILSAFKPSITAFDWQSD